MYDSTSIQDNRGDHTIGDQDRPRRSASLTQRHLRARRCRTANHQAREEQMSQVVEPSRRCLKDLNTWSWSHEPVRCSTCKRSSARNEDFTLCNKTCDACCLRKRQARFNARRTALSDEKEENGERGTCVDLSVRLAEPRICSTCKCLRRGVDFESALRKTCARCLRSRRLARLCVKRARNANAVVGVTSYNFWGSHFGVIE